MELKKQNSVLGSKMFFQTFFSKSNCNIWKWTFPILLVLQLSACAVPDHNPNLRIHAEIMPHITAFRVEALMRGIEIPLVDLIAEFGPQNGGSVGLCYRGEDVTPRIVLDRNYWLSLGNYGREALVFHELGHCLLNKSHNNTLSSYGMPNSLMFYSTFSQSYYEINRKEYLNELFGRATLY